MDVTKSGERDRDARMVWDLALARVAGGALGLVEAMGWAAQQIHSVQEDHRLGEFEVKPTADQLSAGMRDPLLYESVLEGGLNGRVVFRPVDPRRR